MGSRRPGSSGSLFDPSAQQLVGLAQLVVTADVEPGLLEDEAEDRLARVEPGKEVARLIGRVSFCEIAVDQRYVTMPVDVGRGGDQVARRVLGLLDEFQDLPLRRELDYSVGGDTLTIGAALDGHAARAPLGAPELDHRGKREIKQIV